MASEERVAVRREGQAAPQVLTNDLMSASTTLKGLHHSVDWILSSPSKDPRRPRVQAQRIQKFLRVSTTVLA